MAFATNPKPPAKTAIKQYPYHIYPFLLYSLKMKSKLIPGIDFIGVSTPFYCINEKGELLLHKRSKNCRDEVGTWDTGGGQLERLENPVVGVLREVKEEYGCKGEILEELPAISVVRTNKGKKTHWIALPFVIRVKKNEVKNGEPRKIDELGWFDLSHLPKPLHSAFKKYIVESERIKYLQKYLR